MKDEFTLYGYSDDLVYFESKNLEGERAEFLPEHYVEINSSIQLRIKYTEGGNWRIDHSRIPDDVEYEYQKARTHDSDKAPSYSDILVIKTDEPITSVTIGGRTWKE